MKYLKAVSLLIGSMLFGAICFAAGALTAGLMDWFEPTVHVAVRNDSGETLAKVVLIHESRGKVTTVTLPALEHGDATDATFYIAGEGGYRIEATFPDGRVMQGGSGYVEAGYSTSEVIGKSKITGNHGF